MSAEIFRWHLTSRFANTEPLTVSFRGELHCVPAATVSAQNRPSKKPHAHVSAVYNRTKSQKKSWGKCKSFRVFVPGKELQQRRDSRSI